MNKIELPTTPFESFGKISRAKQAFGCFMTEKIDGTNAQIVIEDNKIVAVGSRSRWIKPGKETDNYGFAGWVERNYDDLLGLGDGTHFGEWFGSGIQRAYGLTGDDKRFALFNTGRWSREEDRPKCCTVVPVLYGGEFNRVAVDQVMADLAVNGSKMVPGFMRPEGIIIYLAGPRILLKETFEFSNGKWAEALKEAA